MRGNDLPICRIPGMVQGRSCAVATSCWQTLHVEQFMEPSRALRIQPCNESIVQNVVLVLGIWRLVTV